MSANLHDGTRAGRARIGGEIGVNGAYYKGGRFLPNTQAEPGKWKLGRKWIVSGRELTQPGELSWQPTPFSRSIFALLRSITDIDEEGTLHMRRPADGSPIRCHVTGEELTEDTLIRPGVKGVMGEQSFTIRELMDLYQSGARWIDIKPEAETITTPTCSGPSDPTQEEVEPESIPPGMQA